MELLRPLKQAMTLIKTDRDDRHDTTNYTTKPTSISGTPPETLQRGPPSDQPSHRLSLAEEKPSIEKVRIQIENADDQCKHLQRQLSLRAQRYLVQPESRNLRRAGAGHAATGTSNLTAALQADELTTESHTSYGKYEKLEKKKDDAIDQSTDLLKLRRRSAIAGLISRTSSENSSLSGILNLYLKSKKNSACFTRYDSSKRSIIRSNFQKCETKFHSLQMRND